MSAIAYTVTDSATMLRRNLRHQLRYPSMTLMLVGMPIVFLLLFVYVFGGQLEPASARSRTRRPGRLPQLRGARNPDHDSGRGGTGNRDRRSRWI